jgi:hypothetical protein
MQVLEFYRPLSAKHVGEYFEFAFLNVNFDVHNSVIIASALLVDKLQIFDFGYAARAERGTANQTAN